MARETHAHHGAVPHELGGHEVDPGFEVFAGGEYLLRCASGYGYHYRPGRGITIERPTQGGDADEELLWLNGSVYAAVACLNGLYPLHASAVEFGGKVHAFTGPTGAGKSTLVSALGKRGLTLFCDDTLLLHVPQEGPVIALPGHKRLKLTEHALALTGLSGEQPVGAGTGKSYVVPPSGAAAEPLPLASLVVLEDGPEVDWRPITGAARLLLLDDDHDVQKLFAGARRPSRAELFALRTRIVAAMAMARLTRPMSADSLDAAAQLALAQITQPGKRR